MGLKQCYAFVHGWRIANLTKRVKVRIRSVYHTKLPQTKRQRMGSGYLALQVSFWVKYPEIAPVPLNRTGSSQMSATE